MTARKRAPQKPLSFEIEGSATHLPEIIEQISATPGTSVIQFVPNGSTLKAVTDRIRRIPRQRGLNALTVKASDAGDGSFVLSVTNTGTTAIPWPKPKAKGPSDRDVKKALSTLKAELESPEMQAAIAAPVPAARKSTRKAPATKAAAK